MSASKASPSFTGSSVEKVSSAFSGSSVFSSDAVSPASGTSSAAGISSASGIASEFISDGLYSNCKDIAMKYYLSFVEKDANNEKFEIPVYNF